MVFDAAPGPGVRGGDVRPRRPVPAGGQRGRGGPARRAAAAGCRWPARCGSRRPTCAPRPRRGSWPAARTTPCCQHRAARPRCSSTWPRSPAPSWSLIDADTTPRRLAAGAALEPGLPPPRRRLVTPGFPSDLGKPKVPRVTTRGNLGFPGSSWSSTAGRELTRPSTVRGSESARAVQRAKAVEVDRRETDEPGRSHSVGSSRRARRCCATSTKRRFRDAPGAALWHRIRRGASVTGAQWTASGTQPTTSPHAARGDCGHRRARWGRTRVARSHSASTCGNRTSSGCTPPISTFGTDGGSMESTATPDRSTLRRA